VNLATAFLAAAVVGAFQDTIGAWVALAVFMPIVAGMGGNAATQTLTVIIRGIALGELTWSNSRKALLKNLLVGVGNGIVTGTIAAVIAWVMNGDFRLGVILALAMIINLFVAGLVGTARPEGAQNRPGSCVGRLHHHLYRRLRVRVLPWTGDALHAVHPRRRVE
jgi:magnesium transporter